MEGIGALDDTSKTADRFENIVKNIVKPTKANNATSMPSGKPVATHSGVNIKNSVEPEKIEKVVDDIEDTAKAVEGVGNPIGKLLRDKSNVVRTKLSDSITAFKNSDEYINLSNTQKKKIDRKIKSLTKGNVATADVNISGIKKEFSAHSQIHSIDSLSGDVMNFSYTPAESERIFKNYVIDEFPRYNDTEAKILEDIASKIKDPNVKGEVNLFTELDTCQSCTNIILEFRAKYPNIKLNIFTNNTVF